MPDRNKANLAIGPASIGPAIERQVQLIGDGHSRRGKHVLIKPLALDTLTDRMSGILAG